MTELRLRSLPAATFARLEAEAIKAGVPVAYYCQMVLADHVRDRGSPAGVPPGSPDTGPGDGSGSGELGLGRDWEGTGTGLERDPRERGVGGVLPEGQKKATQKGAEGKDGGKGKDESGQKGDWNLGPFLDAWKKHMGALPTQIGRLGGLLKPLASADFSGTLGRWERFVAGVARNPQFYGGEAKAFQKFAGAPALFDDPDWWMTPQERRDIEKLTEGL